MKIQCNVCGATEASVLCCADEAALCWGCDQKLHAANNLAGKHQRVPVSNSPSQMPKCDICQETAGYFFCLEDRALLCRKCDVSIHTANSFVSLHQRFLLPGVKVGLEATEPPTAPSPANAHNAERISEPELLSLVNKTAPPSSTTQYGPTVPVQSSGCGDFPFSGPPFAGTTPQWQELDELIGYVDFTQNYNFLDSNNSTIVRGGEGEFEGDDCLAQVAEKYWAVPQISSPLGFCWPKNLQNPAECALFVGKRRGHLL